MAKKRPVTLLFEDLPSGSGFIKNVKEQSPVHLKDRDDCAVTLTGKSVGLIRSFDDWYGVTVIPCDIEVQPSYDVE